MIIDRVPQDQKKEAEAITAVNSASLRYLRDGGYLLYADYSIPEKTMYYAAIPRDEADAARHLALPYLYLCVKASGDIPLHLTEASAPLLQYLSETESGLGEADLERLYGSVFEVFSMADGLSPEEAQKKQKTIEEFRSFLNRLEKAGSGKTNAADGRSNAKIQFDISDGKYASVSVNVITKLKEYPIRDIRAFLEGFRLRDSYRLSSKEELLLDGTSFAAPYSSALPLLGSIANFSKKAKVLSVGISYDRLLPVLDVLRGETIYVNEKKTKIQETDGVTISMGEDGIPVFCPPFRNDGCATCIGNDGVYEFLHQKGIIRFHPFLSAASKETYQFFAEHGLQQFSYISNLFKTELLPKIATTVSKRTKAGADPFRISLYLSFDEQERLTFRTVYAENGEDVKRKDIRTEYGVTMANAFLSVLESLSGVENGTLPEGKALDFLSRDLSPLQRICDVFCDERLKPGCIRPIDGLRIRASVSGGYLDLTLDHADYTDEELSAILSAYQKKKKYFLLKDRTLLLTGEELEEASEIFRNGVLHLHDAPMYRLFSLENGAMRVTSSEEAKSVLRGVANYTGTRYRRSDRFKGTLMPYQTEGVKYLITIAEHGLGAVLADEMGLGKTVQMIAYLTSGSPNRPSIVLCPKAVLYNWESEIRRFSDLEVRVVDGGKERRDRIISEIRPNRPAVYVTSYDTFRRDAENYRDVHFLNAVLDEAQSVKNAFSQRHQALSNLHADHRFALTGTPLENSQSDLWSIFDFLMPGYLGSLESFSSLFESSGGNERVAKLLKPFLLRRLKKDVIEDLPEKIESTILVSMDDTQRALYLSYLRSAREAQSESRISVLAGLTRLRQLCVDPASFLEDYEETPAKLAYCRDLVRESVDSGHKVLVFSSFKTALLHLKEVLEETDLRIGLITGDTNSKDRLRLAEQLNASSDIDVMLVSLKAGGVGMNLTGADTVILLDPWWNPSAESQAADRAHRIGQRNTVTVVRLIAKDTVEEKVQTLQQMKIDMFNEIIEGTGGVSRLTDEDIAYLLG
ncbi:MAG: SNF2 helicase associated domain-containing protein [Clostridia bacterium]|nr:SNF2 helicase associated domain-containing protein [Clostridia bacterium]